MLTRETHFEQVSLENLKKLLERKETLPGRTAGHIPADRATDAQGNHSGAGTAGEES
jgi:hypothetical protein